LNLSKVRGALACTVAIYALTWGVSAAHVQEPAQATAELTGHVELPKDTGGHIPATVVWLNPVDEAPATLTPHPGRFTLVQKNRMFSPHLLVIPVGSVVIFPNADPFFHDVFSLFNGKRFDLGLYEAGTSKEVVFSREGVSYIFCNIHPEMSAVVLAISTPLYAIADSSEQFAIHHLPAGEYELHVWIEGTPQPSLDRMAKRVRIGPGGSNSVVVDATNVPHGAQKHLNKFGQPYDRETKPTY
jgi:plastocyanin